MGQAISEDTLAPLILSGPRDQFRAFNTSSFTFRHRLAGNPLFDIPELRELAQRIPRYDGFVYWQNGNVPVDAKWGTNTIARRSLDDTIAGIADNDSLVILKHAEQDPAFGPVLQQILNEIVDLSPPDVRDDITVGESLIFINSPHRKTLYHLDLESNFLLQIRGHKDIHVFDNATSDLVTQRELENHCSGDLNGAVYKPQMEDQATRYQLEPGLGVHFPSMAPHWVENGKDVSVSININFELRSVHHHLKPLHRVNRRLRGSGFSPTPPGTNEWMDDIKIAIGRTEMAMRKAARRFLRPNQGDQYPVWRPAPKDQRP